jgi:hypothetical protein
MSKQKAEQAHHVTSKMPPGRPTKGSSRRAAPGCPRPWLKTGAEAIRGTGTDDPDFAAAAMRKEETTARRMTGFLVGRAALAV